VSDPSPPPPPRPRRGHALRALRELDGIDQAVYHAIAATPSPTLDAGLGRLSSAADHSNCGGRLSADW
jgi:hypothetical protein